MDHLFLQYHAHGLNPADREVMLAAAAAVSDAQHAVCRIEIVSIQAGLDLQRAQAVIEDPTLFDKSVSEAIDYAKQQLGATGVPLFVIHDPISNISIQVPGAQDASTFANLLTRIVNKRELNTSRAHQF